MSARILKTCSCGRTFTMAQWLELGAAKFWKLGDELLELRNCPCGSTNAIEITENADDVRAEYLQLLRGAA